MPRTKHPIACSVVLVAACAGLVVACRAPREAASAPDAASVTPARPSIAPPPPGAQKPQDLPGLHNIVAYHDGFYSGGAPEGREGLETLAAMGIRTIISVDGAEPDAATAKLLGMRYVHLPIGYNGFDEQRKLQLVRATRDFHPQGPVYMHCHHGKHRSAGAAATVAVSLGWVDNAEAERLMKVSGTAANYKGLYRCAAEARPMLASQIDAVPADFPETYRPSGFVAAMVAIDEATDHLKAIEKAGWKPPADHPDLVPAAEAGRLADLLAGLVKDEYVRDEPAEFAEWLAASAEQARILEAHLARGGSASDSLSAAMKPISASCKDCHAKYRD